MRQDQSTKVALLCAASIVALTTAAMAQADSNGNVEAVTVTGSRVISDITLSPTPLTVVTVDQLQAGTPSDIPDALNKLPNFVGSSTPRTQNNGSANNSGNTLNLRNLGVQRTLVLLDGHRVAASNQNGSTNVDVLPQMLMSRVDVVTGGASAVYGSDAVAGVVNFVLDKNFNGFKYNINAGISKYSDAASEQIGVAWGTDLFGGRGHYEMAARVFNQDMVPITARPYGYQNNTWVQAGSGTAAAPFANVPYGRLFNQSQTGTVNCGTGCSLNSYTFGSAGNLQPLTHGVATTTSGLEQGGDGGYQNTGTFQARVRTAEFFNRASYDLDSDTNVYIQGSWASSGDYSAWAPMVVSSASSRPNSFFTNNPYLSASAQASLTTAATAASHFVPTPVLSPQTNSIAPVVAAGTPYFSDASYVPQIVDGQNARLAGDLYDTIGVDRSLSLEAGAAGKLGNFAWDLYYSHGESRVDVNQPNNTNNAKYLAAQDAVIAPAGTTVGGVNVGGTIQCWSAIQPQYAAAYAGCVPINLFNPTQGISQSAFNYMKQDTQWILTQKLDNIGGSISGGLFGLGLPAGEITGALSGEMRWRTYDMQTNALPTDYVNCTGLRLCTTNGGAAPVLWTQNVNAPVSASDNVWETALEVNVPLLKDVPLSQDLSADIAGRYTYYSISGEAETWKIGVNDRVNDWLRLRGTMSLDIRAPNLNDLFQPQGLSSTGFTDLLTGANNSTQLITKGNAGLTPEVAHTETAGFVLTPDFAPGLTISLDYYTTHMSSAITSISYQTTAVQQICLTSAPTYNSQYCALAVRPIAVGQPGYTTAANYPTQVISQPQNSAKVQTEGWDFEMDYHFDLGDVWSVLPGSINLRDLVTYQPVNQTQGFPGAAYTWTVQPKTRMTTFLAYSVGDWDLDLQNQWLSGVKKASGFTGQIYASPRVSSYNVLDVTVARRFDMMGGSSSLYFTVNNIGNTRAPLDPTNGSNPGLFYPTLSYYNDMGRYFTIGIKGAL
jgi:iron complex outermembrane receptor protein